MGSDGPSPEGVLSILDTDLYKLTMQCAVLQFYPQTHVSYSFTNRTPHMRLTHEAFLWLQNQINRLENLSLSSGEFSWLQASCPYLSRDYLHFLRAYRFQPSRHVQLDYIPASEGRGDIRLATHGLWTDTILYEIPLLALVSEAYFKFCDQDWNHEDQEESAYQKAVKLLRGGCVFSEFGTRRRRDSTTQDMVIQGLKRAAEDSVGASGKLSGSSNVYFAMKYGIEPVGTMAHEWFMGIAASSTDYDGATRRGLQNWCKCFGKGVLAVALTDTFGTSAFLKVFKEPFSDDPGESDDSKRGGQLTYAEIFKGVRQDSGDPHEYIRTMQQFYDGMGLSKGRTIVFSDSLNVEKCLEYKESAERAGFQPTFGIGTFFTNDFICLTTSSKSTPLNIVIKLASAEGHPAVKLSDDMGKNTGDPKEVQRAKEQLGYVDKHWAGGDETSRWGA